MIYFLSIVHFSENYQFHPAPSIFSLLKIANLPELLMSLLRWFIPEYHKKKLFSGRLDTSLCITLRLPQIKVQRISSALQWYASLEAQCTSLSSALHSPLVVAIWAWPHTWAPHCVPGHPYCHYFPWSTFLFTCSVLHSIWSILIGLHTLHAFPLKCLMSTLEHTTFCHSTLHPHLVDTSQCSVVCTAPTLQCSSVVAAYALHRSCSA